MLTVLSGGTLIDGAGGVLLNPVLYVEGERITRLGKVGETPIPSGATVLDTEGMTIMPGLIDCHVHLSYPGSADPLNEMRWSAPYRTVVTLELARETLQAGVTTVRDAGAAQGVVLGVRNGINEGMAIGPRIKAAGSALVMTGGHGDVANGFPDHVQFSYRKTVDGVEECRKGAREEIRQGADWLKVFATGGVMSRGTSPAARNFTKEEMEVIVEEAHNVGIKTFAHAQANKGIKNALRAGIDSIEHGVWLDDEAVEMMIANKTYLVPTLSAPYYIAKHGLEGGIPEHAVKKGEEIIEDHLTSFQKAYQAGVNIAMGTDAGTPFNKHGDNGYELVLMHKAGMSAMDTIRAATSKGAELLGIDAGIISQGKLADVLVIDGNPLEDIAVLTQKDRIKIILKDGKVVKNVQS